MSPDAAYRPRRSSLTVPAANPRFLARSRDVGVDEVIVDLEDSAAPAVKDQARDAAVAALREGGWGKRIVAVRVNDATSRWAYRDVIAVVEGAGEALDVIVLPKVTGQAQIAWLDLLLGQLERATGLPPGRIGIEAQIEDAAGLRDVDAIATASARLRALIYGPGDLSASLGTRSLVIGGQPPGYAGGDAYHYVLVRILVAARAAGVAAIDGPYAAIDDLDGLRAAATSSAALGFDGKWVLHPSQADIVNEAFTPGKDEYDRAVEILDLYEHAAGATTLDGEMIDEATRKMALAVVAKARAAAG
jgi:citrate lyase subunit beta / citryl-CoA lyase